MPKDPSIQSVLIIGSGPIIIGQGCEFDYSGSQAALSLKNEGIEVTIINNNPATIMTDKMVANHAYLWPLTCESIEQILRERKVHAVLPTMGGQTALNLCKEAAERHIWEKYQVRVIGVSIATIETTENRESFRQLMTDMGLRVAKARIINSFLEGKEAAQTIGFPLVVRPSYILGGSGSCFVRQQKDLDAALSRALQATPTHEVLVEQAIVGSKELELELLRDNKGNVVVICSIENLDPMGIHTGDSIAVAPAMTLSDRCYQAMRTQAIQIIRAIGDFAGGCNIQFAIDPYTEQLTVIEVNPRVSRSSALASKATGYPIARVAAKLAIGYSLDELQNQITKTTSAYFEPALDYIVVKIPRWNFDKFPGANQELGLQMKSVGEAMGIGRSFAEALQKACQSLELGPIGCLVRRKIAGLDTLMQQLRHPSWDRLFYIYDALSVGISIESVHKATKIDPWFLYQIQEIVQLEATLRTYTLQNIPKDLFLTLKQKGVSDAQIAHILHNPTEEAVFRRRMELGIQHVYKMVDTCAAEFPAQTPYYYATFEGKNESLSSNKQRKILVLGSGPNRIGQGIEFDYSCVHGVAAVKEAGFEAIMINCNPETVSTDFNIADKLYFDPVSWEYVWSVITLEQPEGVIVQFGGQTALEMAKTLAEYKVNIIGTSFENMDLAEDRGRFSNLLKELDIPYPQYGVAEDATSALKVARAIGYPVLIRPSYVLGGQGMNIVINDEDLEKLVVKLLQQLPNNRILIDHFLDRAEEAEADAIRDGDETRIIGIMEHVEPAGIHSGDSSAVFPPFNLSERVCHYIETYTLQIAKALNVIGLLNVQFAIKDEVVYVLEANPRASRTVPFIAKAHDLPYIAIATKVMLGINKLKDFEFKQSLKGYAIKEPIFSFDKFPEINKELGPEMKSTGEAIHFIRDLEDPYFKDLRRRKSMYLSR